MAFNFNKLFVALFFTAVASATIVHGIIIDGTNLIVAQVTALGTLTCQIPGTSLPGNPIYNATVALTCGNASFTPATTSVTGVVLLSYVAVDDILFNSSACTATITLGNAASCTASPPISTVPATLGTLIVLEDMFDQALKFAVNFNPSSSQ